MSHSSLYRLDVVSAFISIAIMLGAFTVYALIGVGVLLIVVHSYVIKRLLRPLQRDYHRRRWLESVRAKRSVVHAVDSGYVLCHFYCSGNLVDLFCGAYVPEKMTPAFPLRLQRNGRETAPELAALLVYRLSV